MLVSQVSLLIAGLVFICGLALGALLARLFSPKTLQTNKVKHQLTAKELELNQVKDEVNQHFFRTAEGLAALSKQLNQLQEQLSDDAKTLASDEGVTEKLRLANNPSFTPAANPEAPLAGAGKFNLSPEAYQPPRDYSANSKGGTLAEGFAHPNFEQPKDYAAESQGGTLAEDFGFKQEKPAKKKKKKKKQAAKAAAAKQD